MAKLNFFEIIGEIMQCFYSLDEMTKHERDEWLVHTAALVLREAGFDMPDHVAELFFYESEKEPGDYKFGLLDVSFNCLAFITKSRRHDPDLFYAITEMIREEAEHPVLADMITMSIMEVASFASTGSVPKSFR